MDKEQIYKELDELINTGDEQKIKDLLIENVNYFSDEIKNKIVMMIFEESLNKESNVLVDIKSIQKDLLEEKTNIENNLKKAEEAEKILDIKEGM